MNTRVFFYSLLKGLLKKYPRLIGFLPVKSWRTLWTNVLWEERHVGECQDM